MCQPTTSSSTVSTSRRADALPPTGSVHLARPRKTWIQQVEEDHGCTIDSLWSSAQDRSLWRSLRPSLVRRSSEWVSEWVSSHRPRPTPVIDVWSTILDGHTTTQHAFSSSTVHQLYIPRMPSGGSVVSAVLLHNAA